MTKTIPPLAVFCPLWAMTAHAAVRTPSILGANPPAEDRPRAGHAVGAHAALWVYDYPRQEEWNVTATNARAWQLDAVAQADRALRP